MTRAFLTRSTALISLSLAGPALADVTPEQVWQSWQSLSTGYGQELKAGDVSRQGDTLIARDVQVSTQADQMKTEGKINEIRFKDLGDGRVEVTMSDTLPFTIDRKPDPTDQDDKGQQTTLVVSQPGLKVIASGVPEDTSYALNAPTIALAMTTREGDKTLLDFSTTLQGIDGSYRLAPVEGRSKLDGDVKIASAAFAGEAKSDADSGLTLSGTIADIQANSSSILLPAQAMLNTAAALRDGFTSDSSLRFAASQIQIDATNDTKPTAISASAASGHMAAKMDKDSARYSSGANNVQMVIKSAELPLPEVKISYAEGVFDLLLPLLKSDQPQDFSYLTKLIDLDLSEDIWGLIDPAKQLPRELASLVIDLNGKMRLLADLLSDKPITERGDDIEGLQQSELHELHVKQLHAKAVGAELQAQGDFTFDLTDKTTYGGLPAPDGKLDVVLKGANQLMDKLVAMKLLPDDQAQAARFMLAMFTIKKEGDPDTVTSTLEFKDKGFFANGQRLQ